MQNHRDSIRTGVATVLACMAAQMAAAAPSVTTATGASTVVLPAISAGTTVAAGLSGNPPGRPAKMAGASANTGQAGKPAAARPPMASGADLASFGMAVARLNGTPIYGLTLDVLHRSLQQKQPEQTRAATLERLVANRLLAAQAATRFREYDLKGNRRVGFDPVVASEDQLVASLRPLYEAANAPADETTLREWRVEAILPETAAWDAVFGAPGKMLLDYSLNPEQLARARQMVLLRSKLPGAERITLYDLVQRLNVQGRVEFFNRNAHFVAQQARQRFASILVLNWAKRAIGAKAVNDLRTAFAEREQARAVMALHGIAGDIDADSPLLTHLAATVERAEIKAWYLAHKEEFSRIMRVKARHIRLVDEASAQTVAAQLARGEDFARLARQVSQAGDAQQGGDLGWIEHEGSGNWLTDLAFTQPAGQVSPPFRSPVGPDDAAVWEIIKVEQREDGYQSAESESVRHTASRAVAAQKAAQQLATLQRQLRQQATLRILDAGLKVATR